LRNRFQERLKGRECRVVVERVTNGEFEGLSGEYVRMRGSGVGIPVGEQVAVIAEASLGPGLQRCRPVVG
jgi:hypothetical protein